MNNERKKIRKKENAFQGIVVKNKNIRMIDMCSP